MKTVFLLTQRNVKIFFRDKSVFLPALIAPLILLFLFIAFLGDVYRDSFISALGGMTIEKSIVEGFAGGWLISSLIAVCAVSIAFTANIVMVQDRVSGARHDFTASPVSNSALALSYFIATAIVTSVICFAALFIGFIYIACVGWYLSVADVFLTILDTFILVLFGTALSTLVNYFIRSQGGITAVEAIVSSAYGFLCGAYMPISSLAAGLKDVILFLPGTYGTSLMHTHLMNGAVEAAGSSLSLPAEAMKGVLDGFDCNLYFFDNAVPVWVKYLVICAAVAVLVGVYILLCSLHKKSASAKKKS